MKVEQSKRVAPGTYQARILNRAFEERPADSSNASKGTIRYMDLSVAIRTPDHDEPVILKTGYAASKLTPDGRLAKLLARFGVKLNVGQDVDVEKLTGDLIGRDVSVLVTEQSVGANRFSRVDADSVRPL